MAPRLSRWIALTVLGVGVIATALISTGGTPIVFLSLGRRFQQEEIEPSPTSRRISAVTDALGRVRWRRESLELQALLEVAMARSNADPLVLRREGGRMTIDAPATAVVDSFWRTLPTRQGGVRTVVLRADRDGDQVLYVEPARGGLCLVRTSGDISSARLVDELRSRAGECIIAEQFGPPGVAVRSWVSYVSRRSGGLSWDRLRRSDWLWWRRLDNAAALPAWFTDWSGYGGFVWNELNRYEVACVVGRAEHCVPAAVVGGAGWPETSERRAWSSAIFPDRMLPRDLLQEVGPQKFGQIWTSDDPIAVSYARVTGAPIDGWLQKWARRHVGTVQRDNGLSLVGWLGALIWIVLLSVLITQRLKQRTVT